MTSSGRYRDLLGKTFNIVFMMAATLLGLLLITFIIGRKMPIDPVLAIVGDHAPPEVYRRVREELGLDLPLLQQFWIYVKQVVVGDFGVSTRTSNPVLTDIASVFPATMELAILGTLIGTVLGVPAGVLAAVKRNSLADQVVRFIGLIGYSVPIFWLGMMAFFVFYYKLGWVGSDGRIDIVYLYSFTPITGLTLIDTLLQGEMDAFWNAVSHIILPASLLGYYSLAYISRMTRSFMLNELEQEYVTAARVKGLSETRIIWRHAFRNAAVPMLTVIVLSFAYLLEGSVLTETVFSWPGLGQYLTNSLLNSDMNGLLGATLVVGFAFVVLNQLSDVLYRILDPRTRL